MIKALWGLVCLSLFSILLMAVPTLAAPAGDETGDGQFSVKLEPAEVEMAVGEATRFAFSHTGGDAEDIQTTLKLPRFIISLWLNDDGSLNCFDVNIPIGTAPGVYKVVLEVTNGTTVEQTEAKINVVIKPPRIDNVKISQKQLVLTGIGFTVPPTVIINGEDVTKKIRALSGGYLMLKGNRKNLNLQPGVNEVYLIVDGQTSETFRFNVD